jgi:hypothetical protein
MQLSNDEHHRMKRIAIATGHRLTPDALGNLDALVAGSGYRLGEPPPEKFLIYVMINWLRRGAKAGQAKSARARWVNDQTKWQEGLREVREVTSLDQLDTRKIEQACRIFFESPFVFHAHLDDPEVFEFFPVLELPDEATYKARAGHYERLMKDTVKASNDWLDYIHEPDSKMCLCPEHPVSYGPYLRCEGVKREMDSYRRGALAGELGTVLHQIARLAAVPRNQRKAAIAMALTQAPRTPLPRV